MPNRRDEIVSPEGAETHAARNIGINEQTHATVRNQRDLPRPRRCHNCSPSQAALTAPARLEATEKAAKDQGLRLTLGRRNRPLGLATGTLLGPMPHLQ